MGDEFMYLWRQVRVFDDPARVVCIQRHACTKACPLNPKHAHGSSTPSSCSNFGLCRAGIASKDFQLDTAGGVTPANAAALSLPPSASMMARTVSIARRCTKKLYKCQTEKTGIEHSEDLNVDVDMPTRDQIIARLRQLPEVLEKTDGEIAELLGIPRQAWSNYKSERIEVTIRPMIALELERVFGVPMSWVYGGYLDSVHDPALRGKLAAANRRAEEWLASRHSPTNRTPRSVVLTLTGAIFVAWLLPTPIDTARSQIRSPEGVQASRLICEDEAGAAPRSSEERETVYVKCMLTRGYVLAKGYKYKP